LADDLRPATHHPADRGRRLPAPLGQQTVDRRTERHGVPPVGTRAGAQTAASHLLLLPGRVTARAGRLPGRPQRHPREVDPGLLRHVPRGAPGLTGLAHARSTVPSATRNRVPARTCGTSSSTAAVTRTCSPGATSSASRSRRRVSSSAKTSSSTSTGSFPSARSRSYDASRRARSEEHTSELQSRENLVCRLLLEKKNSGASNPPVNDSKPIILPPFCRTESISSMADIFSFP